MPAAERLSEKYTFEILWNFDDNLSAKGIIIRYTSKIERGIFIL